MKIIHITFLVATLVVAQLNAEEPSEEAVGFYRTGYQLLKAQNYRNAAIELERAVGADADYGAAHFALGLAYNYLNEYGKSIAALERAMALGIQPEKIPGQLAKLYHKLGVKSYQQKKYSDSIKNLQKALEYNPKNAKAHYIIGRSHSRLRNDEAAQKAYRKVVEVDPKDPKAYALLGDIHRKKREFGPASDMYKKAISVDSTYSEAYGGLAQIQIQSQNQEGAVSTLRQGLEKDPKYANGHLYLGVALNQLQRYHEAIDPLRRATELDRKNAETHFRLAESYYGTGDNREAIRAGTTAVGRRKDYFAAYVLLGDANAKLGQVQEAKNWYSKAVKDSRFKDYCTHQLEELSR